MFRKVIYPDGTSGMVNVSKIYGLINAGKIIAFHYSDGWLDVRRKNKGAFNGVDRRKTDPDRFYSGFEL